MLRVITYSVCLIEKEKEAQKPGDFVSLSRMKDFSRGHIRNIIKPSKASRKNAIERLN